MVKKNLPMMSNIDMSEIYRNVLLAVGEELPEFLIFDNQPFDEMRFEMPNGRNVLYFNNCDNICEKIISEIKNPSAEKDIAPDFMVHSLKDEDVAFLYTVAVLISEMLDIPCPQIEFRDFLADKHGESIGERNYVILATVPNEYFTLMIRCMAHEIRHLWQYKYHPEYNESYKDTEKDGVDSYLDCIAENDAEAWASKLYLEIFNVDDIEDNEEYAMGNVKRKEKILKLRDEIELDEEYVYRLKMFLGVSE